MVKSVLVVDSDPVQRRLLEETVGRLGFNTKSVSSGEQALQILESPQVSTISLVVLDLTGSNAGGIPVLDHMQGKTGIPPIIVQAARGELDTAIDAMRAGAVDFVVKPASPQRLEVSIKSALKIKALADAISRIEKSADGTLTFDDLIIRDEAMERVVVLGKRAAASTIPVLIEGEAGVGKGMIARAIQGESDRAGKPFVVVNCGAIAKTLVEATLFGQEAGNAPTGKFQEAEGGTLFLDEIGELPLSAQGKLLRALQDWTIDPVGSNTSLKVDVRLIAATSRDMIQLVRESRFREDLYYRLNVFPILMPRLRDRMDDVPELALHFMARFAAEDGKRISGIETEAIRLLKSYAWPGNVRQLENVVFRAVVLSDGPELTVADFPQIAAHVAGFETRVPSAPAPVSHAPTFKGPALLGAENVIPHTIEVPADSGRSALGIPVVKEDGDIRSLEDIEADMIRLALGRYRGHMTEVAKRLKIGRSTLYRKMQEYGLEPRA